MGDAPPEAYSHLFLCLERSHDPKLSDEMRAAAKTSVKGLTREHPLLYMFVALYDRDRDKAAAYYEAKVKDWVGDGTQ